MSTFLSMAVAALLLQSPSARRQAEVNFEEGRDLMKRGRIEEACSRFEKSQQLDPALGTLLNLATCYERRGRLAQAYELFTEAIAWAVKSKQQDREKFAINRSNALRPRLAWLTITAQVPLKGMMVTLDTSAKPLGTSPLVMPIDVGTHVVTVSAPLYEEWQIQVMASKPGATENVIVPALTPLTPENPLLLREPTAEVPTPDTPARSPVEGFDGSAAADAVAVNRMDESNVPAVTTLTAGAVVAVAGAVGLVASHRWYSEFEAQRIGGPNENNPTHSREDFDRLRTLYTASWVGIGAGLAASAIGGYLLATPTSPKVAVLPSSNGAFVTIQSTF